MRLLLSASALLFISAQAISQDASAPTSVSSQEPANQAAPPSTQVAILDGNTPLEEIVSDPVGKAALEKNLPGVTSHPAYEQVKAMSLRQLLPHAQPVITEEKIVAFETELKSAN